VSGQKVWTSTAQFADLGFALIRTDPDSRRNAGITCMVIDMHAPGVTVRPLKQISGAFEFNEVFFEDVLVPDVDVVGQVDAGWKVARTTLGNERISLMSMEHVDLWQGVERLLADDPDPVAAYALGRLAATQYGLVALQARTAVRAMLGEDLGIDGNIGKLAGGEMAQRLADLGQDLLGTDGLVFEADASVSREFLRTRALTIAGGTSEIIRNVIAELALGLPRDPRPSDK
jgi:alkylation response protein AidB-like acyl-CoA dehydrogenase